MHRNHKQTNKTQQNRKLETFQQLSNNFSRNIYSNIIQSIEPLTTTQIKKKISSIDLNTKNLKNSNQIYSIPKTKK